MTSLSRFVLLHKRLVVAFWALLTVVAIATASATVDALSDDFSVPGRAGAETSEAILRTYGTGGQIAPLVPVVTLPEGMSVDTPGVREELSTLFAELQTAAPTARIASYPSTGDRTFVSEDGRTTFGLVFTAVGTGFAESPDILAVKDAVAGATVAGSPVLLTGYGELETGGAGSQESNVLIETLVAAGAALIILAWVFGSFLALVPLLVAAVSILVTLLLIYGVTTVADVSFIVEFIVALIGLGVAIDYALLIVTRWREERAAGHPNDVAVQRAMETAGSSVVFSGTTVAVGLFALVVLPVPFLRSIGYAGMLIPLVSVLVSITLLPVILATIGPRLDWPRRRRGDAESRLWTRWARLVVRRRWLAATVGVVALLALLVPALSLNIGDPQSDALARTGVAREGLDALIDSGIGPGVLVPFEVLASDADPGQVATTLAGNEGVRAAVAPEGEAWRRGGSALVIVIPSADSNSDAGEATLERGRNSTRELAGTVRVGGLPAQNADFIDAVYGSVLLMIVLIALVTYALLVRAFRSLLLPLKAILLNVASVGAAFGVMTLVWQEGRGAGLIWGYQATGAVTSFIPLVVFAFLFGLSMDYEVFILARMREEYDLSGDTDDAIVHGLGATGRLVTSAALILFFAFGALASAPVIPVKVLATGLAAGILLDATIIRALLVPASVSLFGKWNWWLPGWLTRFVPPSHTHAVRDGHAPPLISEPVGSE